MAKRTKKRTNRVSDRLREAVESSGLSLNRLCELAGIDIAAMSRFMHGTGLNLESIDRLCEVLNLRLVEGPAAKQPKGK